LDFGYSDRTEGLGQVLGRNGGKIRDHGIVGQLDAGSDFDTVAQVAVFAHLDIVLD